MEGISNRLKNSLEIICAKVIFGRIEIDDIYQLEFDKMEYDKYVSDFDYSYYDCYNVNEIDEFIIKLSEVNNDYESYHITDEDMIYDSFWTYNQNDKLKNIYIWTLKMIF